MSLFVGCTVGAGLAAEGGAAPESETAPVPVVATAAPDPTPTSTPSATPEPTPTATPTAAPTPEPTPAPTPAPAPVPAATAAPTPTAAPTAEPPPAPDVEACFSPWDGNLDALEDLVRPLLHDEGSMETHETRWSVEPDANGYHTVLMEYSAKNTAGGREKVVALGLVHGVTCVTLLVDPGF